MQDITILLLLASQHTQTPSRSQETCELESFRTCIGLQVLLDIGDRRQPKTSQGRSSSACLTLLLLVEVLLLNPQAQLAAALAISVEALVAFGHVSSHVVTCCHMSRMQTTWLSSASGSFSPCRSRTAALAWSMVSLSTEKHCTACTAFAKFWQAQNRTRSCDESAPVSGYVLLGGPQLGGLVDLKHIKS